VLALTLHSKPQMEPLSEGVPSNHSHLFRNHSSQGKGVVIRRGRKVVFGILGSELDQPCCDVSA
jgi:hypothetical protein